jgi:ribosomal protein S18 acetylase RimI-like enzyme
VKKEVTDMLINVKNRIEEPQIQELLSYSIFPDPEQLDRAIAVYKADEATHLYVYESEERYVGIIGYRLDEHKVMHLLHLAVEPESRGVGFGRGILLETIAEFQPARIVTETDEEAVEFYRNVGFVINSLGEKYPGVERFQCTYEVDEETAD